MIWGLWRLVVVAALFASVYSAAMLYRVKAETRATLRETVRMEAQANNLRDELAALEIEWAYLNGPEHLNRLVGRYSDALRLMERVPDSFARLSEVTPRGAGLEAVESPE